jgi:phage shock protein PspC (stress-responsive transcriptional regulator)
MKNRDHFLQKHKEHHPQVSFGLFLIALGLALLVATNDMLNLGGVKEYFTWESAMVFIGVLLILNLQFTGGLLVLAAGVWFMMDHLDYEMPGLLKTIYWPGVIILIGLGFIISSLIKSLKRKNN